MNAGTPAWVTASSRRAVPWTFVRAIANSSCDGCTSHARCTQASAPATSGTRSSVEMSADRHVTLARRMSGRRWAIATMSATAGSSESIGSRLVPTLPVPPTRTIRIGRRYPGGAGTTLISAALDLTQLVERAAFWVAVGPPSKEPRWVPKPVSVEAVVLDLAHPVQPDGDPVHRHVGRPAAGGALQPPERARRDQEPFGPRMLAEW